MKYYYDNRIKGPMNYKKIVKLTNIIGIFAAFCLIYWIFISIAITAFDLKVFRQGITNLFFMSIGAIIVLMASALMLNIMINLTRIAERDHQFSKTPQSLKKQRLKFIAFIASFPIILAGLGLGHFYTIEKRRDYLETTAAQILAKNQQIFNHFVQYQFDETWIKNTADALQILSKYDSNMPTVKIILQDAINDQNVYLAFSNFSKLNENDKALNKINYLFDTTKNQREYLDQVFHQQTQQNLYEKEGSRYRLFVPYEYQGQKIILYISDYYAYGKSS